MSEPIKRTITLSPNEYQALAIRTEAPPGNTKISLGMNDTDIRRVHAMIGIATESGEIATALKRFLFYGKAIDVPNLIEECGDLLWYIAVMLSACGESMEICMKRNINKLSVRYPEKFTEHLAENRRLDEERRTLEGKEEITRGTENFEPVALSSPESRILQGLEKEVLVCPSCNYSRSPLDEQGNVFAVFADGTCLSCHVFPSDHEVPVSHSQVEAWEQMRTRVLALIDGMADVAFIGEWRGCLQAIKIELSNVACLKPVSVLTFEQQALHGAPMTLTPTATGQQFEVLQKEHEASVANLRLRDEKIVAHETTLRNLRDERAHFGILIDTRDRLIDSLRGQLKLAAGDISSLRGQLEAAEKEVKILREQRESLAPIKIGTGYGTPYNRVFTKQARQHDSSIPAPAPLELTFNAFQAINRQRNDVILGYSNWPLQNWALALCGEAGELANIVKKIVRGDISLENSIGEISREIGDVISYADLLLSSIKVNTAHALATKFNEVSMRRKETYPYLIDSVQTARATLWTGNQTKVNAMTPVVGRLSCKESNLPPEVPKQECSGPIRIYLAARYSRRLELGFYRDDLMRHGYDVQARWLNGEHQVGNDGTPLGDNGVALVEGGPSTEAAAHLRLKFALDDYEDVSNADVVICFTESPHEKVPGRSRGGRHVEMGIALALKKGVIVIGHRENIFCHLPQVVRCLNWEDFITSPEFIRGVIEQSLIAATEIRVNWEIDKNDFLSSSIGRG